jgi:hypothetical protein
MNTAAASVPAISSVTTISAQVRRVTAPSAAIAAATPRRGHARWLATAAAAAVVILTALTFVLNALEAQEGAEYGAVSAAVTAVAVTR